MGASCKWGSVAATVAIALGSCCVSAQIPTKLPDGWRMPTESDLRDTWRDADSRRFAHVAADLDGDGFFDHALILVTLDGAKAGLHVYISSGLPPKWITLDVRAAADLLPSMGIREASKGTYQTACGKGYWLCRSDEVPNIDIPRSALNYFKVESANSFFYWSTETKAFHRIWISD